MAKPDNSVKTTLITVIGSITVALVTTLGTIYINSTGIKANSEKLEVLDAKAASLQKQNSPVGTIIASLLTPAEFAKETGDPDNFDVIKSNWTLADGKTVSGTRWASLRANAPVPNLCGIFLRGKNNGKREGIEEIPLGDYRADTVGPHNHDLKLSNPTLPGGGLLWDGGKGHSQGPSDLIFPSSGAETQPKNVTVNYYVKIND
jgi:hypothetical protein